MEQDLLQRLLDQAFLYDDPHAYQAGVQAAWGLLADRPDGSSGDTIRRDPSAPASAAG